MTGNETDCFRLLEGICQSPSPVFIGSCLNYILPLFSEPLFSYYQIERQLSDNSFVKGLMIPS